MAPPAKAAGGSLRPNLCRCGHLPLSHMRVVAMEPVGIGNYRLEPSGACAVCGAEVCARFRPGGVPEPLS